MNRVQEKGAVKARKVLTLWGADVTVTPLAWVSVPFFILIGTGCAVAMSPHSDMAYYAESGVVFGLLLFFSNIIHTLGHVMAGRVVGAPNGGVRVTAMFHVNYHQCDPVVCTRWTHIGRSLGGPIANLLVGGITTALASVESWVWIGFLAKANVIVGAFLLLPIPKVDGWVIWGELLGFRRRK